MTRDELVTALRGILGYTGTLTEGRVLAQIDAYANALAATERERIRQLAVDHTATYDERSPCDCGRVNCTALARSRVPFADLITEPPTEGSPE